jgi:hypothetical protein
MSFIAGVRQLLYPKEFRIAPLAWPDDLVSSLERLARSPAPVETAASGQEDAASLKERVRMLADVGTGLWRLRQKMVRPGTSEPLDDMRRAYRHLESVWDTLAQSGLEIQDHTDTLFDSGLSLKVIAFQPTPGLGREMVIETIKPTIYYKGQSIQMGEVIVGTPERADDAAQ